MKLILILVCVDVIVCNVNESNGKNEGNVKNEETPMPEKSAQSQNETVKKRAKNEVKRKEDEPIEFKTTKIVTGLEYLGSGYDIVKANTLGDSDYGEDLGYRAPVIEFIWAQTDVGVTNSLDSLQPVGGWVRPKVSCGESEDVMEIDSISKMKDVTEADVGITVKVPNAGTGSLSTQYENLKDEKEGVSNKLYTNAYYCFTYAAGIPPTLDWITTDEFTESASELPKTIKHYEECTIEKYKKRKKVCSDLLKWMEFFSEFGTHVVTQIHLGGKLTRYLSVPSSVVDSLAKNGFEVNAVIGAAISGVNVDVSVGVSQHFEEELKNLKKSSKLKFSVMGGIHPDKNISPASIRKWKSTVPKYPMPIRMDLVNISTYLPREYYNAFKEAMNFYIGLNEALPWDIEEKEGRIMTLKSILVNSTQVIASNANEEIPLAKCPKDKRVLFGFILNIDKELKTEVYPCPQNKYGTPKSRFFRAFCTVDKLSENSNTFIYILCGNSLGLEFKTKYENNQNELTCDEGDQIITGFNMMLNMTKVTPCKTGASSCETDHKGAMMIVCADKRIPELKAVETVANIVTNDKIDIGDTRYTLIGLVGCIAEKSSVVSACSSFANGCKLITKDTCNLSIGWGMFTA
ncbi:MAC/perforin [Theileria orientalis strain Shintoku]|uniref:MAC/perforin n=1 Tax=Theileria orientalis strain Shintoku TaxID=869250 RepID=J4C997_THEOR|nr:MAC/perforin [Theileria orientalis strain Shintoku]BAM42158.1 MAC/perforin [Theileria orientalis strain Shintoku]|eukprot:XP_009692459.1 MAC/perforin [Theileria orientalis strain Shintoku]